MNRNVGLKGINHLKKKFILLFTHPHVVPNPYDLFSSVEKKGKFLIMSTQICYVNVDGDQVLSSSKEIKS